VPEKETTRRGYEMIPPYSPAFARGRNRDYDQHDFARYVDGVVADEVARGAAATFAAGRTPSPPRTLADYAGLSPAAAPAC
jgi:hypothetical protein